ncbi:hypothetical protein AB0M36_12945 [Actinoplanes sp. NPDC051346]|uniref:hypothetical protein n=1 Tax=Actinoplanes sp. NPDC051346 TaxID=3155048 RepID=UPI003419BC1B
MARHGRRKGRFDPRRALRFAPLEVAIGVAGLVLVLAGLVADEYRSRAITDLIENGRPVEAKVTAVSWLTRLRFSTSADLTYAVGGISYHRTIHYPRHRKLTTYSGLTIFTDPDDPTVFTVANQENTGTSTGLWLLNIGGPVLAVGAVALFLVLYKHQWRFDDDDD